MEIEVKVFLDIFIRISPNLSIVMKAFRIYKLTQLKCIVDNIQCLDILETEWQGWDDILHIFLWGTISLNQLLSQCSMKAIQRILNELYSYMLLFWYYWQGLKQQTLILKSWKPRFNYTHFTQSKMCALLFIKIQIFVWTFCFSLHKIDSTL